jgi:hypothetical protein
VVLVGTQGEQAAQPLTFGAISNGERLPIVAELEMANAQILMDGLWSCGLRPSEGKGSAGQLAAVERHLQDMRALVARHTRTELPGWRSS